MKPTAHLRSSLWISIAKDHPPITPRLAFSLRQRSHHHRHHHHNRSSHSDSHSHSSHQCPPTPLLAVLPSLWYLLPSSLRPDGFSSNPDLSPNQYTTHTIHSIRKLEGGKHVLIRIELSKASREAFGRNLAAPKSATTTTDQDEARGRGKVVPITIYHVNIKSPDLQIERPYTPINDPERDGYIDLVVKRVRGGEVGRYIHSLREAGEIEIRGPIPTVTIPLDELDELDMISTGTGIAPFLQLISRLTNRLQSSVPSSSQTTESSPTSSPFKSIPTLNLFHYLPSTTPSPSPSPASASSGNVTATDDLASDPSLLPRLNQAWADLCVAHPSLGLNGKLNIRRWEEEAGSARSEGVEGWTGILSGSPIAAVKAVMAGVKGVGEQEGKGWWDSLWGSASNSAGESKIATSTEPAVEQVSPNRGVIVCLPQKMLTPLVGHRYPLLQMKKDAKLEGVLGEMGFRRGRVWVL